MSDARFIVGDIRHALATLRDGSVDLVLTSPPFLALRSYLPPDHPDKPLEIGSESTPGEFIDTLLDIIEAVEPKLATHGSIAVELGDTYSGSGGAGGDYNEDGLRHGQERFDGSASRAYGLGAAARPSRTGRPGRDHAKNPTNPASRRDRDGWPLAKSLCLIPELLRISVVYGFNPLTGRETPRWRARNVVRWCRPNPPVGALGDKFRPATSEMVVLCKSATRYFDLDAVRTEHKPDRRGLHAGFTNRDKAASDQNPTHGWGDRVGGTVNPAGAPPLDWWEIPTEPYAGSHYATWPTALLTRPIQAMCPTKVCTVCGEPSRRIVAPTAAYDAERCHGDFLGALNDRETGLQGQRLNGLPSAAYDTLGWTDCGHDSWRRGLVLDPFAGSGTTLAVATGHGRNAIGIDLDARNADLARQRVGMFLTVEDDPPAIASQPQPDSEGTPV